MMDSQHKPSLLISLIPIVFLISLLGFNIAVYQDYAAFGPNQVSLLLTGFLAMSIGMLVYKQSFAQIEKQIIASIGLSMQAILILILVGALIGLWILSGVVPLMIYYGLKMINPTVFLPVACIVCCIVSVSTGSSWSTTGTIGIALVGIGRTLGIPDGMVAGAIISGAYFGDKISPLSDTTNLAPAMAGTDLFTHVRHLMYTTVPSITIAITGFFILGFFFQGQTTDLGTVQTVLDTMSTQFNLNPILFLVPILVIVMIVKKMPAIPALIISILISALFAVIFQQDLITRFLAARKEPWSWAGVYEVVMMAACRGFGPDNASWFTFASGSEIIDKLFNRGGMFGMLNTVWLILMAMVFGGTMEGTGMLQKIALSIMKFVHGVGTLIGATLASCIFVNIVACDQYLAIVVPGRMFRNSYPAMGLHPKNLSRALEDAGTVTSVLIPWNSCGAYNSSVLNISTLTYLPFCFFNLCSPIISGFYAGFDITIARLSNGEQPIESQANPQETK